VQDHGSHERECILAAVNLILIERTDFVGATRVCLRGRRLEHARGILRAEPGDVLRVGIVDGEVGSGTVVRVADDALELEVALGEAPPEASPLALALALPRPPQLRRVLQSAAALGVKHIALFHSARVEKSFWQSTGLSPQAVREQLLLGLEQARDTRLPRVDLERRFRPFAEDRLAGLSTGPILVAHPDASEPCPHALAGPATLVVGPEGGFVDFELERLAAVGGRMVGLGPRVLRVETAVTALLARLSP
jgi:RsmE family RNA methyltransferase